MDEARGINRASDSKPVQLCVRVADFVLWHAYAKQAALPDMTDLWENQAPGIRAFGFIATKEREVPQDLVMLRRRQRVLP